jgi:hypothetical protein
MRRVLLISCVVLSLLAASACSDDEDRKVKPTPTTKPPVSGVRRVAAITGDATGELAKQINDGSVRTLILKKGAKYRVDGTIKIRNKQNVTLDGNGATIYSARSRVPNTAQISIQGGDNIIVRNLTINGVNPNAGTAEAAYNKKRAFEHGIEVLGASNVELDHLTINDVFGDFVYVGRSLTSRTPSSNVFVHDGSFHRNGRQGIGITDATNVVVKDNTFGSVRRTLIDLEPGASGNHVNKVFILANEVFQSRSNFVSAEGQGAVDNVMISGNILRDQRLSIYAKTPAGSPPRENWVISWNSSETTSPTPTIYLKGINGVAVLNNRQRLGPGAVMVDLDRVCGATVSNYGNTAVNGQSTCAATLVSPEMPPFIR